MTKPILMFNIYKCLTSTIPFSKNKSTYIFKKNYIYSNDTNLTAYFYYNPGFKFNLPIDKYSKKNNNSSRNSDVFTLNYFFKHEVFIHIHQNLKNHFTTSHYWSVNNWYERELHEFYNIKFSNSLDSRCLLLPYSFLNRKNFYNNEPTVYYGLKFNTNKRAIALLKRNDVLV